MLLLEILGGRGVDVDVLYEEDPAFASPGGVPASVRLLPQPESFFVRSPPRLRGLPFRLVRLLRERRRGRSPLFDPLLFALVRTRQYGVVIGVDPYGIVVAHYLNRWAKKPLVYISFELLLADEALVAGEQVLYERESAACRQAALVLIQDEERARVFCEDHGVAADRVVLAPVAPPPRDMPPSNYLRERLGIPSHRRLVLYCGALEAWASRDDWEEMVSYWPDDYCLVIHSRSQLHGRFTHFLKHLARADKIVVSSDPVPRQDMVRLVGSADFGLAPYKPNPWDWMTGRNLHHLGLSSGKIAFYAMCGLPILARSLPVFEREFARYECGRIYHRLAETGRLLTEMERSYEHHRAEARRFYRERLDPSEGVARFSDRMLSL